MTDPKQARWVLVAMAAVAVILAVLLQGRTPWFALQVSGAAGLGIGLSALMRPEWWFRVVKTVDDVSASALLIVRVVAVCLALVGMGLLVGAWQVMHLAH